jgi:hypothetical protein
MQIASDEKESEASSLLLPTPHDVYQALLSSSSSSSSSPIYFSQTPFLNAGLTFVHFNFLRTRTDLLEIAQTPASDSHINRTTRLCILDPSKCTVVSQTKTVTVTNLAPATGIPTLQEDVPPFSSSHHDSSPNGINKMVTDNNDLHVEPSEPSTQSRGDKNPTMDLENVAQRENILLSPSKRGAEPYTAIQHPGSVGDEKFFCTASSASNGYEFYNYLFPRMHPLNTSYSAAPGFGMEQAKGENKRASVEKLEMNAPLIVKRRHEYTTSNERHAIKKNRLCLLKKSSPKHKGKKISSSIKKNEMRAPLKVNKPAHERRAMSNGQNAAEGEERPLPLKTVSLILRDKKLSKSMKKHDHRKLLAAMNSRKRTMSTEKDAAEVKPFRTLKNLSLLYKEENSYAKDGVRSDFCRDTHFSGYSSHHQSHFTKRDFIGKELKQDSIDLTIGSFEHKYSIEPMPTHNRRPLDEGMMQQLFSEVQLDSWTCEIFCFLVSMIFLWIIRPKSISKTSRGSEISQLSQNNVGIIESYEIEPKTNSSTDKGGGETFGIETSKDTKESVANDEDNASFLDGELDNQIIAHGEELERCLQEIAQFDKMGSESNISLSTIDQRDSISIASLAATCQDTSLESLEVSPTQNRKEYLDIPGHFNLLDREKDIIDILKKKISIAEQSLSASVAETLALKEDNESGVNSIGNLKREILDLNLIINERDGKIMTLRGQVISKKHTIASLRVAAQKDIEAQHSEIGSLKATILSMTEGTKLQKVEVKGLRQELASHTSVISQLQTLISSREKTINELKDKVMSSTIAEDQKDEDFLNLIEETESQKCAIKVYKERVEQLIMHSKCKSDENSVNLSKNCLPTLDEASVLQTGEAFKRLSITEVNPGLDHSQYAIASLRKGSNKEDTHFVNLQSSLDSKEVDSTNLRELYEDRDTKNRDRIADLELKLEVQKEKCLKAIDRASLLEADMKALTLELQERDRYHILISQHPDKSCTSSTISSTLNSPRRNNAQAGLLQKKKEERRARINLRSMHTKISHPMNTISVTNRSIASGDAISWSTCSLASSHRSMSEIAGERLYQRALNRRTRLDDAKIRRFQGSPKSEKVSRQNVDTSNRRFHNRPTSRKLAEKTRWRPY